MAWYSLLEGEVLLDVLEKDAAFTLKDCADFRRQTQTSTLRFPRAKILMVDLVQL